MAVNDVLERKNELLRRKISEMILKQNAQGLGTQESKMMQHFIKELHENTHSINHS